MTAWFQERDPRSANKRSPASLLPLHPATAPLAHDTVQRAQQSPQHLSSLETLQLQRTIGNQATQRLMPSGLPVPAIQRAPNLIPGAVGALNRPNWANQHERRYQELVGDLEKDPKAGPLFSFKEYQEFEQEYKNEKETRGGADAYAQHFDPGQFTGMTKASTDGWGVYSFNPATALKHWRTLMTRIERIDSLNNGEFKSLMAFYITALSQNKQQKAGFALLKVIDYLDTLSGFQVSRADTKRNQDKQAKTNDPDIAALQKETAKVSHQHGQLWSKLNKYIAYETAKEEGGLSLERTLGAKLFDGLDFGTTGQVLNPQWTSLSAHFVRGLRGTIHAHAFRGAVTASVFSSTEWPRIQVMMEAGEIEKLIIHVYDFGPNGKDLEEDKSKLFEITKDNYKSNVVKFLDQEAGTNMDQYWKDQTNAHHAEEARHQTIKGFRQLPFHHEDSLF